MTPRSCYHQPVPTEGVGVRRQLASVGDSRLTGSATDLVELNCCLRQSAFIES